MIVAGISVLSELVMVLTIMCGIYMLGNISHRIKLADVIISLGLVAAVSICFNLMFYSQSDILQFILLILNYFKFIAAVVILYRKCNIKIICLTYILHSICNICQTSVRFVIPMDQTTITYASELSLLTTRIIFLLLMILFQKRSEKYYSGNILTFFPNYIFVLVLVNLFLADGLIEVTCYKDIDTSVKIIIIKIIAILLTLCVLATLVSLLFSVISKKYYSDINRLLEKQVQAQINHYAELENTYTEIRKFRHDYTNHVNCIHSMLKAGRYDEIAEYLENITEIFPVNEFLFNTGNFISDAILSEKQNSVKSDNITIQFDGTVPTSINETDLCIILGNAVDNAVEACRPLSGEKKISVYGGFNHGYFILTVTNPTDNPDVESGILPITTKTNKYEHGFGLSNIKSVVDKYNGYMKVENKDNVFTLSLTFNSIVTESVNV